MDTSFGKDCEKRVDCKLECSDEKACAKVAFNCPPDMKCEMVCGKGHQTCHDANLNCDAASMLGDCRLTCNGGGKACEKTDIVCGPNQCGAFCSGGGNKPGVKGSPNACNQPVPKC